jgi:DNA-binding CsgD family transcriptional regulator
MYCMDNKGLNDIAMPKMTPAIHSFCNWYQFTQRESEILILIAVSGLTNREIADKCVISEKTAKNHVANIMRKTEIGSARKLLSLLLTHVLSFHENQPTKIITQHTFGQLYEETKTKNAILRQNLPLLILHNP